MSNQAKDLRKQLRNVVQEVLPELLQSELVKAVEQKLRKEMNDRLNLIDKRQKDIQGYVVRQSNSPIQVKNVK
jgi:hypothetical protein